MAFAQQDVGTFLGFYHPDAQLIDTASGSVTRGWRQLAAAIESLRPGAPRRASVILLAPWWGAVIESGSESCETESCPDAWANMFLIYDDGIGLHIRVPSGGITADDQLLALYEHQAAAWSGHDVDDIVSDHSDASFAPEAPRAEAADLLAEYPRFRVEPLTLADLGVADSAEPALFDAGNPVGGRSPRGRTALGVYRLTFRPGLAAVGGIWWDLWDDQIVSSMTLLQPDDWDHVLTESGESMPPDQWFSTIRLPEPTVTDLTHVITAPDGSQVELYGASASAAELVEWALGRFADADLPIPHAGAVHIEAAQTCLEGSAWAITGGASAEIRICLDESQLGSDGSFTRLGEVTVLHELAHVWSAEYLSEEQKQAFLDARGLSAWWDPSVPWVAQGTEHAAEIVAWGVAEDDYPLVRIPHSDCETVVADFRALTGVPPLHGC